MAKKTPVKAPTRKHPSELRTAIASVEEMQKTIQECGDWLSQIQACVDSAKAANISEFQVDGATQLTRAKELLEKCLPNIYTGVIRATIHMRRETQ